MLPAVMVGDRAGIVMTVCEGNAVHLISLGHVPGTIGRTFGGIISAEDGEGWQGSEAGAVSRSSGVLHRVLTQRRSVI